MSRPGLAAKLPISSEKCILRNFKHPTVVNRDFHDDVRAGTLHNGLWKALLRLFDLDPIQLVWMVNEVEKLDRQQKSIFHLAPFAAGGGERGKMNCLRS